MKDQYIMHILWMNNDDDLITVLGQNLYNLFKNHFELELCTIKEIINDSSKHNFIFTGAYCEYDYIEVLAVIDQLKILRSGLNIYDAILLNNKRLIQLYLEMENMKYGPKENEYPRIIKRSNSCGSSDQYIVYNKEVEDTIIAQMNGFDIIIEPFVVAKEYSINYIDKTPTTIYNYNLRNDEVFDVEKKNSRENYITISNVEDFMYADAIKKITMFLNKFNITDITRVDFKITNINEFDPDRYNIYVMDINNVACCNFELLTENEKQLYILYLKKVMSNKINDN